MSAIILEIAFWILGPITVVAYGCMAATVIPGYPEIRTPTEPQLNTVPK